MQKIFQHKHFIPLLHILFWAVIWSVPLLLVAPAPDDDENWLVMVMMMTWLFYINTEYFYPRFWHKKQFGRYTLATILAALLASLIYNLVLAIQAAEQRFWANSILKWFMGTAFIAIGTLYKIVGGHIRQQRIDREKENEKLRTELSFLRSQVSPHFMFNVLNTLVSLIRRRSDELEPAVMKLSHLLRYMIYESDDEKVSVSTEAEYLKSYIDLQLLRFGDVVKTHIQIPESLPDRFIEPMLLIPLVENAFKHGMNVAGEPEIILQLQMEHNRLALSVYNKKNPQQATPRTDNASGIGLVNLRRRLELLYPEAHHLYLNDNVDSFTAILEIELKNELPHH